MLWQTTDLRRQEWAVGLKQKHCYHVITANDKATAQKQMTENHRHQCEVFAKYGRQTQSCHQLCLLQIQAIPLQLCVPTIRHGFILAFISSCGIMKNFFPCFFTMLVMKGQKWSGYGEPSLPSEIACHAGFLQRFLTMFQNDTTEDKRSR